MWICHLLYERPERLDATALEKFHFKMEKEA